MNSYMELQDANSDSAYNCIFIVKAIWKIRLSERMAYMTGGKAFSRKLAKSREMKTEA
jgi:hypothetical protein